MKLVFYSGGHAHENSELDQTLLNILSKKDVTLTFIPSCSFMAREEYGEFVEQYKKYKIKKIIKFDIDQSYSDTFKSTALNADIIHLGGGNTYYFLHNLRKKNILNELKSRVKEGCILTGLSAGAIIMTKNINTAGFPDFDKDENEDDIKNLTAMGLVNFEFFPHYKNSKRYDQELLKHSKNIEHPLYACPDGSGIVVLDKEIRFIGKTACFYQGKKVFLNR